MGLKEIREKAGLTQEELAEKTGLSLETIRAYEQGKRDIKNAQMSSIDSLTSALHCTYEDFSAEGVSINPSYLARSKFFGQYPKNDDFKIPAVQMMVLIGAAMKYIMYIEREKFGEYRIMKKINFEMNFRQDNVYELIQEINRRLLAYDCNNATIDLIMNSIFDIHMKSTERWELSQNTMNYYIVSGQIIYREIYQAFQEYAWSEETH